MYLSYFGIRVMDLGRSLKFYTELFGLTEIARGDSTRFGGGAYVLLRDNRSGQRLELNWYPKGSRYDTPYSPGEGLDHIAFKVDDVKKTLQRLATKGVHVIEPDASYSSREGAWLSYVTDPDGNWIELYHHPEPLGPSVAEAY